MLVRKTSRKELKQLTKSRKSLSRWIQDAEDLSERVQARHEVKENTKGYHLEDKGRKVPVEQNRPEDLM